MGMLRSISSAAPSGLKLRGSVQASASFIRVGMKPPAKPVPVLIIWSIVLVTLSELKDGSPKSSTRFLTAETFLTCV